MSIQIKVSHDAADDQGRYLDNLDWELTRGHESLNGAIWAYIDSHALVAESGLRYALRPTMRGLGSAYVELEDGTRVYAHEDAE